MYRMSRKEKNLLYSAVIFVSLAVFSRVVLHPAMAKSTALNYQIQLKKKMIENSLRLLSQEEEIRKKSRKYAKYVRKEFSEEKEIVSFLKEVEDIARISQVQLIDLKPYSAEKTDFYTENKIEVETESNMNQLVSFIYNLQSSGNLLRVVKFRISPKVDKANIIKAHLTITKVFIF